MLRTSPSRPWRRSTSVFATLALAGAGVIAAAPAMAAEPGADDDAGECVPASATSELTWNIHDSFLSYITGPIANGEIDLSGGAGQNAENEITWGEGTGGLDDGGLGTLSFPGVVHLTGHDGDLDTTFSNIRLDTSKKQLIADVKSQTMGGEDASVDDAAIAELMFSELDQTGGTATANLTAAGSVALAGFYEEGQRIAPVSFAHTAAVECSTEPEPVEPTWVTTADVTEASAQDGLKVHIEGSAYLDLPKPTDSDEAVGVYVALRDKNTLSYADINENSASPAAVSYVPYGDGSWAISDGRWSRDLVAPVSKLSETGDYEVVVWVAHGDITDETLVDSQPIELTPEQKEALFADDGDEDGSNDGDDGDQGEDDGDQDGEDSDSRSTDVTVNVSAKDGLTIDVSGAGYTDLPESSTGRPASGVYAALRDAKAMSNDAINKDTGIVPAVTFISDSSIPGGKWSATLQAGASKLSASADYEVIVWVAHGDITNDTLLATKPITLTDAQRKVLFSDDAGGGSGDGGGKDEGNSGGNGSNGGTSETGNGDLQPKPKPAKKSDNPDAVVVCTTETVPGTAGTPRLSWGVRSSFASYIEGGIAKGSISTSNGAARGGGTFSWGSGSGSLNASGLGTVSFPGVVHFSGHNDVLNTTISNVRIKVTGANSGILIANVKSQDMEGKDVSAYGVTFANLSFSSVSDKGGKASATLTAAGAKTLAGFYSAGEALDSVTISMAGATAATTQEVCHDQDGNRVNPDGTPYTGSDGLAHTGLGGANDLLGLVAGLTLAGAVLLIARSHRTSRRSTARG